MKVTNSGYNYRHDSAFCIEREEGVGEYVLLIIRSPARITINNQTHYAKGNMVVVYNKNTPQYYCADNATFINDWVQFDLDKEDLAFCKRIGIPFDTLMEFSEVFSLSSLVKQLYIERWSNNPYAEESKALLLRLLLLKLSEYISKNTATSSQYSLRLSILRDQIYSAPQKDWSIKIICKSMHISSSYLYVTYKRLFGSSIKEDIITSRMERSKYLLSNTNYKISTISQMVGYENDVNFMYIFKKKTGLTPSQYRTSFNTYFKYIKPPNKVE